MIMLMSLPAFLCFFQVGDVRAAREVFNGLQSAPARKQTLVWNTMLKVWYIFG